MGLIKISDLRSIAETNTKIRIKKSALNISFEKTASVILENEYQTSSAINKYNIFLSHSFKDALAILGLKLMFEDLGYSVFVDWIEEEFGDRENVNAIRANELRERMKNCDCLLFVTSENSFDSKWMPWELGFFDGLKNKVAIIPLNNSDNNVTIFTGQEYLGIYPYIIELKGELFLLINFPKNGMIKLNEWFYE